MGELGKNPPSRSPFAAEKWGWSVTPAASRSPAWGATRCPHGASGAEGVRQSTVLLEAAAPQKPPNPPHPQQRASSCLFEATNEPAALSERVPALTPKALARLQPR